MKQPFPQQVFVTGTGTGVGKTIVSAILTEALGADYWKPVQCGSLENSDSQMVKSLLSGPVSKVHPEAYTFKAAASPHYAAEQEGKEVDLGSMTLPANANRFVIEGAGGLMVPLNRKALVIDYIQQLNVPVILVSRNYLGAINHTLMSIEILKNRGVAIAGIIFNGLNYFDNEAVIQHFANVPIIGRTDEADVVNANFVLQQAKKLREGLSKHFEL